MTLQSQNDIVLRCYIYEKGGKFWGECIDLDILVKRDTLYEAATALDDALTGYVDTVAEGGWLEQLLPRRSPFFRRARYYAHALPWRMFHTIKNLVERDRVVTIEDGKVRFA